jgi:hypothetical protein
MLLIEIISQLDQQFVLSFKETPFLVEDQSDNGENVMAFVVVVVQGLLGCPWLVFDFNGLGHPNSRTCMMGLIIAEILIEFLKNSLRRIPIALLALIGLMRPSLMTVIGFGGTGRQGRECVGPVMEGKILEQEFHFCTGVDGLSPFRLHNGNMAQQGGQFSLSTMCDNGGS